MFPLKWLIPQLSALILGLGCLVSCSSDFLAEPEVRLHSATATPPLLSSWGVVKAGNNKLVLGKRVLPYDLNTPLFTDYAHKLRTLWIPQGLSANYESEQNFTFPVGTILSKTFYYPISARATREEKLVLLATEDYAGDFTGSLLSLDAVHLVETRLLVHQQNGWQALAYIWNDAQTDALLEIAGDIKQLNLKHESQVKQFYYVVPTRNECASCHASDHTSGLLHPIGPKARHLNKNYAHYSSGAANQLGTWQSEGLLDNLPAHDKLPTNALWQAGVEDNLEYRARSYLDINCAHCHNPKGAADTSGLFLQMDEQSRRRLGTCKPPVAAGRGTGDLAFSLVPGAADKSILVYRMQSTDPGEMMPELGRSTVHSEGLKLLSDWIDSLTGECN